MKLAVLFARLGPYHVARLRALSRRHEVTAIELSGENINYDWKPVAIDGLHHKQLFECNHRTVRARRLRQTVSRGLEDRRPDVVAVPGWWDPGALAAIEWACERNVPVVLMSDSTAQHARRTWWREMPKRRVVRLCHAALVAGQRHARYVQQLGMPEDSIYQGYDVVHNSHFVSKSGAIVSNPQQEERLNLPERYFLTCCRFIEEKNLPMLLRAYAGYRDRIGSSPWPLVIVGDGPQRDVLVAEVQRLGLEAHVYFPGFKQYEELPAYYGHADAFILPSKYEQWGLVVNEAMAAGLPVLVSEACGCAPDLVVEGENGWTFSPDDPDALAQLMSRMSGADLDREAMGRASRNRIQEWSPETFAQNMSAAAEVARRQDVRSLSWPDRLLLRTLTYKVTLAG